MVSRQGLIYESLLGRACGRHFKRASSLFVVAGNVENLSMATFLRAVYTTTLTGTYPWGLETALTVSTKIRRGLDRHRGPYPNPYLSGMQHV